MAQITRLRTQPTFDVPAQEARTPLTPTEIAHIEQSALPHASLKTLIVEMTPALAWRLLQANMANRPLTWSKVEEYTQALRNGEWLLDGQSVKVSNTGKLIDGQHRCCAVINANMAVPMFLICGIDEECFKTMDTGKKRSPGDMLAVQNEEHHNLLASGLRLLSRYEQGRLGDTGAYFSHAIQEDTLARHPAMRESARAAGYSTKLLKPSNACFLHYLFSRKDPAKADRLLVLLREGIGFEEPAKTHPIYTLRKILLDEKLKRRPKLSDLEIFWLCIRAWNDWRLGQRRAGWRLAEWDHRTYPTIL